MVLVWISMENGAMTMPSSILLLHGLGGSGQGSVSRLEERLRDLGWADTVYLRPTLQAVHTPLEPFDGDRTLGSAWNEMNGLLDGRTPNLVVGFSFGGLLAAFSPAPLRLAVCSPWDLLPAEALHRAVSRHGLGVLQGMQDAVVPAEASLAVLPPHVPVEQDWDGSHDFDAWMDRIAAWVRKSWERHPFGSVPVP